LARVGLNALEYWLLVARDSILEQLDSVLPLLDDYLLIQSVASQDNEYSQVQIRIVRLLGRLGGRNVAILANTSQQQNQVAWDSVKRLKLSIPFQDMRTEVNEVVYF
jgi:hypothetical protein